MVPKIEIFIFVLCHEPSIIVYGYGALKFLTMNVETREKLKRMGILDLVLIHLKLIAEAKAERKITGMD